MKDLKRGRYSSVLRDAMSSFLLKEIETSLGTIISVSNVVISQKNTVAKIFVSVYPEDEREGIEKMLKKLENKAVRYIKDNLRLKKAPKIVFVLDVGESMRERIENILKS